MADSTGAATDVERWATFDCDGTLIDWNAGIRVVLARAFGEASAGNVFAAITRSSRASNRMERERIRRC